jgi:hypothetical protein
LLRDRRRGERGEPSQRGNQSRGVAVPEKQQRGEIWPVSRHVPPA